MGCLEETIECIDKVMSLCPFGDGTINVAGDQKHSGHIQPVSESDRKDERVNVKGPEACEVGDGVKRVSDQWSP